MCAILTAFSRVFDARNGVSGGFAGSFTSLYRHGRCASCDLDLVGQSPTVDVIGVASQEIPSSLLRRRRGGDDCGKCCGLCCGGARRRRSHASASGSESEESNNISKGVDVGRGGCKHVSVLRDLVDDAHGSQVVDVNVGQRAFKVENVVLAVFRPKSHITAFYSSVQLLWEEEAKRLRTSVSIVVFEERIQAGGIDEDILRANDSQAPSLGTAARIAGTRGGKVGIVESSIDVEGRWGIGIWLVVSGQGSLTVHT